METTTWKKEHDSRIFWQLIELAQNDRNAFVAELHRLDRRALIRFSWAYEEYASELLGPRFLRHFPRDLSEDSLDDLSRWIVEQGREHYEYIRDHPKEVPATIPSGGRSPRLYFDADNVFEERFGEGLPPVGCDY